MITFGVDSPKSVTAALTLRDCVGVVFGLPFAPNLNLDWRMLAGVCGVPGTALLPGPGPPLVTSDPL